MELPLTKEYVQEVKTEFESKKNKPMSAKLNKIADIMTDLINDAYYQGIQEGYEKAQSEIQEKE